jgi:hypothetical protein
MSHCFIKTKKTAEKQKKIVLFRKIVGKLSDDICILSATLQQTTSEPKKMQK